MLNLVTSICISMQRGTDKFYKRVRIKKVTSKATLTLVEFMLLIMLHQKFSITITSLYYLGAHKIHFTLTHLVLHLLNLDPNDTHHDSDSDPIATGPK